MPISWPKYRHCHLPPLLLLMVAGSLMAFERLSEKLGRLFEPYVIHILPMLLVCFGDTSPQVREATDGAARTIMGQLSAQGVKLVLPALLKGVEDKAWRTKQGSIQVRGRDRQSRECAVAWNIYSRGRQAWDQLVCFASPSAREG